MMDWVTVLPQQRTTGVMWLEQGKPLRFLDLNITNSIA